MNVIIFGPPGAGKGTQSQFIKKNYNLIQISTGDLLRNEINLRTDLGKQIELKIKKGELVSDEIVNTLIKKIISNPQHFNKLIFDGYPRTLSQSLKLEELLKEFNQQISAVITLNVDKDIISKRINGRIVCTQCLKIFNEYFDPPNKDNHNCGNKFLKKRSDDNDEIILKRIENYVIKSTPILDHYKKKGYLHEIDGNQKVYDIYHKIKDILDNIKH